MTKQIFQKITTTTTSVSILETWGKGVRDMEDGVRGQNFRKS